MRENTIPYEDIKTELLKNPEVRQAYEAMEPAYQLARLRIKSGLTQAELAKRVGTTQSSIARIEGGTISQSLLQRMATALDARIVIVPADETSAHPQ